MGQKWPAGHRVGEAEDGGQYVPEGHIVGMEDPAGQKKPRGQVVGLDCVGSKEGRSKGVRATTTGVFLS